jgi:hypothetical protein
VARLAGLAAAQILRRATLVTGTLGQGDSSFFFSRDEIETVRIVRTSAPTEPEHHGHIRDRRAIHERRRREASYRDSWENRRPTPTGPDYYLAFITSRREAEASAVGQASCGVEARKPGNAYTILTGEGTKRTLRPRAANHCSMRPAGSVAPQSGSTDSL